MKKSPERVFNYRVYVEKGKIVNEQTVKIFLDEEGIDQAIAETKVSIEQTEQHLREGGKSLVNLKAQLEALENFKRQTEAY